MSSRNERDASSSLRKGSQAMAHHARDAHRRTELEQPDAIKLTDLPRQNGVTPKKKYWWDHDTDEG